MPCRLTHCIFSIVFLLFADSEAQRGHLQSFGHQTRRWLRVESRYDKVSAEEFYATYVKPSIPVIIRGGIADWPAIQRWPDLNYMSNLTGDLLMSVDWRGLYPNEFHVSRRSITTRDFISRMHTEPAYMDAPLTPGMSKEVYWPEVINCEYFIPIMRTGHFFFNNGKSSTAIHIDGCETLFLQIAGRRLWLMTPPEDAQYMYAGEKHHPHHGSLSRIFQRKVNMTEFPDISKARVYAAMVYPGDFIYLPEAWFHNVQTRDSPNMATTVFFDSSNCEKLYSTPNVEEYTVQCEKHRRLLLPKSINCPKKFPPKTSFFHVAQKFGKSNPKIQLDFNDESEAQSRRNWQELHSSPRGKKRIWTKYKASLPRMVLDADIKALLDSRSNTSLSIIDCNFRFFNLRPQDIVPIANHLQEFRVKRYQVSFLLILPHQVSAQGVEQAGAWLDNAISQFDPYPVEAIDLVLMELPPCVPASRDVHDCHRDDAINPHRRAVWTMLETRANKRQIRHLGVKDISVEELQSLAEHAKLKIAVVCLRIDPLYRQMEVRKVATKMKAVILAHSVSGSGWTRDEVSDHNPVMELHQLLTIAYSNSLSSRPFFNEWAIKKNLMVMTEKVNYWATAEIEAQAMLQPSSGLEEDVDSIFKNLVPQDEIQKKRS